MKTTTENKLCLSLDEVATRCGVSILTVRRMLKRPVRPLPHLRIGDRVLVREQDLAQWLEDLRAA